MPTVIGLSVADAQTALTNAGLRFTSDAADSDQPAGTVIDVEPGEGAGVAPGSRVVITVSNGPSTTGVPAPPPGQTTGEFPGNGPAGTGPPGQAKKE